MLDAIRFEDVFLVHNAIRFDDVFLQQGEFAFRVLAFIRIKLVFLKYLDMLKEVGPIRQITLART